MSTYEKRANLAATQVREPALETLRPVAPSEGRAFTNRYEIKYLVGANQLADIQASNFDQLPS